MPTCRSAPIVPTGIGGADEDAEDASRGMTPLYQQRLAALREAFPAPVSDPVHDGYVVFSLLRALDRVDALKSQAPILGTPREPDYAAAAQAVLSDGSQKLEAVIPQLVHVLDGMLI